MKLVVDKRSRRKSERPLEIMSAALELFLSKGYSTTTLTEIANSAGISKGTLFLYFQCKSALFQSVIEREITELQKLHISDFISSYKSTRERLDELFIYWHESNALVRSTRLLKLIAATNSTFPELLHSSLNNILNPSKQTICNFFSQGIQRGELKKFDVENEASLVMASLAMMALSREFPQTYCIDVNSFDPQTHIRNLTSVITAKYMVSGCTA